MKIIHKIVVSKEIQAEYQHIMTELDHLQGEAQKLREGVEQLPGDGRDLELQGKLTRLFSRLNEYSKEARTRETLSSALVSEEEKLREKLVEMETEQVCLSQHHHLSDGPISQSYFQNQ